MFTSKEGSKKSSDSLGSIVWLWKPKGASDQMSRWECPTGGGTGTLGLSLGSDGRSSD
eukprot:Gb_09818 [translate_table: standard]